MAYCYPVKQTNNKVWKHTLMLESIKVLHQICSAIQKVRHDLKANREQAMRLIERIDLLKAALEPLARLKKATPQLQANLTALAGLLTEIQGFIHHYSEKLGWFQRVLRAGNDVKQFEAYTTRLHGLISQMSLSVNVDAFCYQRSDQAAASTDLQLIQANRTAILELNQIARYQFEALKQQGGEVEGVLKCGLYQLGDQVGAVKAAVIQEHKDLQRVVAAFRESLARKDKRLNVKLDQLGEGMEGLAGLVGGLKVQADQHQDALLLQLQSMRRHMLLMEQAQVPAERVGAVKPGIDPHLLIPLYEIELEAEPFAKGSFGVWYRGLYGHETVAVKLLRRFEGDDAEQFYREVRIMSQLRSKYVPQLYGASVTDGQAAIVMSYKEGMGLNTYLGQHTHLTWEARSMIMQDLVAGVAYLHGKGVVHRALKSSKVLVDDEHHACISDFGLALASQMSVKSIKRRSEAFAWMAPECWRDSIEAPSDVYSLGVILLEIMSGQPPIEVYAAGVTEVLNQQRLSVVPDDCPVELKALVTACLGMDPAQRPEASEVAERLKGIVYRPPSPSAETLYQQGVASQKAGDMEAARACYERSQGKGYPKALTSMGLFHLKGWAGCHVDKGKAHDLFLQAADQGHVRAMMNLVNQYGYGDGIARDYKAAYEWAKKAWDKGEPSAKALYDKFKSRYEAEESQLKTYQAFSS